MVKKIDIFFVCDESYSLFSGDFSRGRFGGAGLQMYLLATEIAKDPNYDVHWLFINHPIEGLSSDGITFLQFISPVQHGLPFISRIINKRRRSKMFGGVSRPLVLTTIPNNLLKIIDMVKNIDGRVIYRVASDADLENPFGFEQAAKDEYYQGLGSCSALVVQSSAQAAQALTIHNQKAWVAGNGISLKHMMRSGSRDIILWVSSSHTVKQPWYFVDLARNYPNYDFVMICPPQSPEILDFIQRISCEVSNLTIIGDQVTLDEVNEYMRRAIIFVNTSHTEGFPNTFLQAWGAGTPVLSLSFDPDGILKNNELGLCADGNVVEFFELFYRALLDSELRSRLSNNGFRWVAKNHNIESIANRYKKMINSVAGRQFERQ